MHFGGRMQRICYEFTKFVLSVCPLKSRGKPAWKILRQPFLTSYSSKIFVELSRYEQAMHSFYRSARTSSAKDAV